MSREYPVYAITAVGAILISNGEILLVKRGSEPGKGLWSIPGGAIEAGESIYGAAQRELYEETGISAKPIGIIGIVNLVIKDKASKPIYHYAIIDVLFDEKTMEGVPRPGGDAIDVAFVPLSKAINSIEVSKTTKALLSMLIKRGTGLNMIDVCEISITA